MRGKILNIKVIEIFAFAVIWLAIFCIPFFHNRPNMAVNWDKVIGEWIRISAFLVIFLFNATLLVPKFLFEKRYVKYVLFALVTIFVVFGVNFLIGLSLAPPQPIVMPPMDLGPGMPPMELGSNMALPMGYRPIAPLERPSALMLFIDNLIIAFLVVGAGTTFKMVAKWLEEEGRREDIEKVQLKTELAFLRHQVSPHFFMNTLNNIHALIDINAEDAKDTIIELSTMMRYLLYDTAHGHTTLKKEVEFIESYIALMKLRFPKNVVVTLDVPTEMPDVQMPPMLFTSFLENAFKHGVSYQADSFVDFKLAIVDKRLVCNIRNSNHKASALSSDTHSGIGLANIKKSLDLLFGNDYTLNINKSEDLFELHLNIPIV